MNEAKTAPTEDGSNGDHYRVAILELLTPTGLTMEKYRTELEQNLIQIRARLKALFSPSCPPQQNLPPKVTQTLTGASQGTPTTVQVSGASQGISTIVEVSESDGEGGPANGHTLSHNDSGKNSLPRRILRRLIPTSVGRKDV